jgi:hypothetical protein
MTYYIYKTDIDSPRVLESKYNETLLQASRLSFVNEQEEDPKLRGDEEWVDGNWISRLTPHTVQRSEHYPPIGDQLDSLWHAMDRGELPKIAEFYDPIKEVKDTYPK